MSNEHQIIEGDLFSDNRGTLSFVNAFSLQPIVRFYEIAHNDTTTIRAWQAHKKESKWFYCSRGAFKISLVKLDTFDNPSDDLEVFSFELNENKPQILYIPGGYANGFKAITDDAKLMVFSNFDLETSKQDDYRFETNKWINKW
ncbi:dTDP-4-dehydrorhamnose 3,5-epimerase family protein [Psychroserpens algicola]|uniref:dTDP-4-dehydrorhamnose 3,5-epimerase family protein n=1 Tax=Psychroserpens algicola TaxID=1719034 RepID=UPI0019538EA2|nr:dTDP-4-dehydrorhamnose 3,5-epimerase family protein [Psychroserpens algicola]